MWREAEALLPKQDVEAYTQGLMDLGATVCTRTRPRCDACPVARDCVARREGRVDELPSPRPRRAVPQRAVRLLVCEHDGRLLLERRPTTGVWSGLWSLPEAPMATDAAAAARARTGARVQSSAELAPVVHAFTHFTLTMHPRRFAVSAADGAGDHERWLAREQALSLALPAPIRRLIAGLR